MQYSVFLPYINGTDKGYQFQSQNISFLPLSKVTFPKITEKSHQKMVNLFFAEIDILNL